MYDTTTPVDTAVSTTVHLSEDTPVRVEHHGAGTVAIRIGRGAAMVTLLGDEGAISAFVLGASLQVSETLEATS